MPSVDESILLGARIRRSGLTVAVMPGDWAAAAGGVDVVIGSRAAAWAPCPDLAAVVVADEHDDLARPDVKRHQDRFVLQVIPFLDLLGPPSRPGASAHHDIYIVCDAAPFRMAREAPARVGGRRISPP